MHTSVGNLCINGSAATKKCCHKGLNSKPSGNLSNRLAKRRNMELRTSLDPSVAFVPSCKPTARSGLQTAMSVSKPSVWGRSFVHPQNRDNPGIILFFLGCHCYTKNISEPRENPSW
jgi:hypothetical protein